MFFLQSIKIKFYVWNNIFLKNLPIVVFLLATCDRLVDLSKFFTQIFYIFGPKWLKNNFGLITFFTRETHRAQWHVKWHAITKKKPTWHLICHYSCQMSWQLTIILACLIACQVIDKLTWISTYTLKDIYYILCSYSHNFFGFIICLSQKYWINESKITDCHIIFWNMEENGFLCDG